MKKYIIFHFWHSPRKEWIEWPCATACGSQGKTKARASSSWPFTIGAADVYSLTIRYANTLTKEITGSIKLYGPDGGLLKSENVRFTPSKTGKWNYITTDTGTMVNAGRYSLVIDAVHASGLYVSGLEIQ